MKRILIISIVLMSFVACNVQRVLTTTQTTIKGKDTIVVQTVRNVETYDASIKR